MNVLTPYPPLHDVERGDAYAHRCPNPMYAA